MPIIKSEETKKYNFSIWFINESIEDLLDQLEPTDQVLNKINRYKKILRKQQNIAGRILLNKMSNKKTELLYKKNGTPYCENFKYISISHSKKFCGVITSNHLIGLDIQHFKENLQQICNRFLNSNEKKIADNNDYNLHIMWCAKEAIYKTLNGAACSFKENIYIDKLTNTRIEATYRNGEKLIKYNVTCQKIQQYFITIATIKDD